MCSHCGRVGHFRDTCPALIHDQFGIAKNMKNAEEPKVNPPIHTKWIKTAKVKATLRKSVKKVPETATQSNSRVKESMIQGESGIDTTDQVSYSASKLNVLASAINFSPLDTLPHTSEKSPVEKLMVEENTRGLGKEVDATVVEPVVEGEGCKVPVQKKTSDGLNISWTKDEEDEEGDKEEEAESDTKDKIGEQANNSTQEKNLSEKDEVFESEGEVQEKVGESEEGNNESEEEEWNGSEESEGSMLIGNTAIAPSEEIGAEMRAQEPGSLLAPFTRDDVPLSEVGKKLRKTNEKATKITVSTRKKVVPPARTPLTRSKRKVVDAQIMKESKSAKKPKKKVSIVEHVVEVD
nr:uncharacterized protein LOC104101346 [Nicotiana tomentosiformis]